jgi:hypothetical protein
MGRSFPSPLQDDRGPSLKQRHFSDPKESDCKRKIVRQTRSWSTSLGCFHGFYNYILGSPFGYDGAHSTT